MAELNPNAVTGLGSKLNIGEIIDRFMAIEQRRIKPVEDLLPRELYLQLVRFTIRYRGPSRSPHRRTASEVCVGKP